MRYVYLRWVLVLAIPFLSALVHAAPNGRNVTTVQFSNGSFEQTAAGTWQEFGSGSNAPRFTFSETQRDDWSVYLLDQSRGVRLQLDLHRRWIRYADGENPQYRDLYQITNASERVNGRMVSQADFANGSFQNRGNGRWVETGADGRTRFNFRETNRDMWSVYLTDDSRGVQIQVDMHRRWIRYADGSSPFRDLYQITSAR